MNFPPVTFGLMRIFNAVILLMVSNLVSYVVFVVNHVCLPHRELQYGLLLGLGWLRVHDSLVHYCAVNGSDEFVHSGQLEP